MKQKKDKQEYIDLSEALYSCFAAYIGTEDEQKLFEDSFVARTLKKFLGKKEFDKFDSMDEKYWKDSWNKFDKRVFLA